MTIDQQSRNYSIDFAEKWKYPFIRSNSSILAQDQRKIQDLRYLMHLYKSKRIHNSTFLRSPLAAKGILFAK